MASSVYFSNVRSRSKRDNKIQKLINLYERVAHDELIKEGDLTAFKIHFGESGSDAYIRPIFLKPIVDKIKEAGGKPFVTDTNTLYSGSRHNAVDHLNTAIEHGFVPSVIGAPVIIADGLKSHNITEVEVHKHYFDKVKIASDIAEADAMIVFSHFKGHEMAGFGGSIKNLAMGCAPASGKRDQHSTKQFVIEKRCISCGRCLEVCPEDAITINTKAFIDRDKCIGCGECMTVCPTKAIALDWATEIKDFTERMVEYAYGAVKGKEQKVIYFNFLMNITPDCDCTPWSDASIVRDIGILASTDPVALDKASLDLVNKEKPSRHSILDKCDHISCEDIFKAIHPNTRGDIQIDYADAIGLGSKEYELIEI